MHFPPQISFLQGTYAQNWIAAAVLGAGPGSSSSFLSLLLPPSPFRTLLTDSRRLSQVYLSITALGAGAGAANSAFFSSVQNTLGNVRLLFLPRLSLQPPD